MLIQATNWNSIKQILEEILELDIAERQKRLKSLPKAVREEVESLLVFEQTAEKWKPLTAVELAGNLFQEETKEPNSLIGQRIGFYEITQELGFGGMGAVYLGKRADGKFEQKVALKMLRREFNIEKIRRYFKRESEIQAKLEHQNIARLLDVGTTGDGVPFFVMEYIEGVPVDQFCEINNLDLNERLKLFNRICQAVGHAHRNLIIHRDLKPSNIFVNREGEPKLLDFGISKLLNDDENEKTSLTALGAMTPEYASPEQIKGETVSTAADIYSLGVVLYKMLTGKLPYNFKNKSNDNLLKEIADSEPIFPSRLKGDLDNIISKSLSKEPLRRYATVEQFSADVWRYLDGLPIEARPATLSYRASKFFRRNRVSVIAAGLILLSLIGGITISLYQATTARAAQNAAEKEEEKAKKISDFMTKIIAYGSPFWMSPGYKYKGETKVIEALLELDDRIDIEFAGQPDIQADLHLKFAGAYHFHVGDEFIKKKRFHIDRALELRKQLYGDYHEKVAETLFTKWASLPTDAPHQAEILMEAINMMRGTNPNNNNLPYMYEGYTNRLAGTFDEIKYEESNPHQIEKNVRILSSREQSELYRKAVQPPTDENNYQIAERMLRESLPILRRHYKEDNFSVVQFECYLSYVLAKQNNWTDFDEHFRVCRQVEKVPENYLKIYQKKVAIIEENAVGRNAQN